MTTSRRDGTLVLELDRPYKMASDAGQIIEARKIYCLEFNSKTENIAFDIEQMLDNAILNVAEKRPKTAGANVTDSDVSLEQKKMDKYYKNNSPSHAEVRKDASMLLSMFMVNSEVKLSLLMNTFKELVSAGRIKAEGNVKINDLIWDSIDRRDKTRILFSYISFFDNPLQRQSETYMIEDESKKSGLTESSETL
jgi:hypothetical protein